MEKIGFANKFYTLWEVSKENVYFTDNWGKHHLVRVKTNYFYIKNVSFDIETVKALYPGVEIDEDLRGISTSFSRENSQEDLSPEIFKFGKYSGSSIYDVVKTDFNYILWVTENIGNKTSDLCSNLPEVVEYLAHQKQKEEELYNSLQVVSDGEVELTFVNNPNHQLGWGFNIEEAKYEGIDLSQYSSKYYATASLGEGSSIFVIFDEIVRVEGLYPYNMAVINGKPVKLKNKTFTFNIEVLFTKKYRGSTLVQQVVVIK